MFLTSDEMTTAGQNERQESAGWRKLARRMACDTHEKHFHVFRRLHERLNLVFCHTVHAPGDKPRVSPMLNSCTKSLTLVAETLPAPTES